MQLRVCRVNGLGNGVLGLVQTEPEPSDFVLFLVRLEGPAPVLGYVGPSADMKRHNPRPGQPHWHGGSIMVDNNGKLKEGSWPGIPIRDGAWRCYPIAVPTSGEDFQYIVQFFVLMQAGDEAGEHAVIAVLDQAEYFRSTCMIRVQTLLANESADRFLQRQEAAA